VALQRWGEITQSLKFEYICKSQRELFWVLYNMVALKSPQKLVGFAPRLTVHNLGTIFVAAFRHPLLLLNSLEDHCKRHCF
jgi:hypothetical protein